MNDTDIQSTGGSKNPVRPLAVDTKLTDIALLDGLAFVCFWVTRTCEREFSYKESRVARGL